MLLQLRFFWFSWSTWSFIIASGARQTTMIIKMLPAFPFIGDCGKSWKIKLFPKPVGRTAKTSSIDLIFIQSFCSLWRQLTYGKSFSVLFITSGHFVPRHFVPSYGHFVPKNSHFVPQIVTSFHTIVTSFHKQIVVNYNVVMLCTKISYRQRRNKLFKLHFVCGKITPFYHLM